MKVKYVGKSFGVGSLTNEKNFELPLSLTDLADYLNIDRSAVMRELKLLKEDGLVEKIWK